MASVTKAIGKFLNRLTAEKPEEGWPQYEKERQARGEPTPLKALITGVLESEEMQYPGAPLGPVAKGAGAVAPAIAAFTKSKYGPMVTDFIRSSKTGGKLEKQFLEKNFNRFLELYPEKPLDYMKWEHIVEPEDARQLLGSREQPAVGEFWAPKLGKMKSQFMQNYYDSIEKFKTPEAKAEVKKAFDMMEQTPGMFTNSPYGSGGILDAVATKIHELMHNLKFQSHKGSLGMKGRQLEEKEVGQMERELVHGRHSQLFEKAIADYENLERDKAEYFARKLQQSK
jgi:hypothetical protein